MRFQTRQRHVIDLVFPIALFFVFAASALVVLILAADIYASTTNHFQSMMRVGQHLPISLRRLGKMILMGPCPLQRLSRPIALRCLRILTELFAPPISMNMKAC